jgi:hypothetical protein
MKNVCRSATALLLVTAVGCTDSDPGEVIADLEVEDVQLTVQELVFPLNASLEATFVLQDAFGTLLTEGLEFDQSAPAGPGPRAAGLPDLADLPTALPAEIPVEMLGQTFVYDPQQDAWLADEARTGAPGDGVRVIWYDLSRIGDYILPLVERGFVDLVPADTGQASRLSVRMVDATEGVQYAIADYTHGYRISDTDPDTAVFEADGFYANGVDTTDFVMRSGTVDSGASGNVHYAFVIDLVRGGERYVLDMEGSTDATTGDLEEHIVGTVEQGSVHTILQITRLASAGSDDQGGTISYNGQVVANVRIQGGQFEFTPPGGGLFANSQRQDLDALTRTLALTGVNVVAALPLLYPN